MFLKDLAVLYEISDSTFLRYRKEWMAEIEKAAKTYTIDNKKRKQKKLSKEQIIIIVKLMQDPPEGYKLVRGKLIKLDEKYS